MAITNGTFNTNLSGWTTFGINEWYIIWENGSAHLHRGNLGSCRMSQSAVLDQNTLKFDYVTSSYSPYNPPFCRILIGGVEKYYVTLPPTGSGTKRIDVTSYLNQTATIEFGIPVYSASVYVDLWIDNVELTTEANATFSSIPTGAKLWIDDVETEFSTPCGATGLSVGSHTYKLVLSGYADVIGSFTMTTSSIYIPVTFSGSAYFTSSPSSGVRIWIDGIDTGINTPGTVVGLTDGAHSYILKKTGYYDATGSFIATGGQTTTVPLITLYIGPPW